MSASADRLAGLTPEKRALLAKRLGEGPAAAPAPAGERIAVVATACRLPGGADSPDALWRLLAAGRDAVGEVPAQRWNGAALFDDDAQTPQRIRSRHGAFLDGVDRFDAAFFGISPREAAQMDPQQRLLMELAWEVLEAGGQPVAQLAGSATGVFIGAHSQSSDYWLMQLAQRGGVAAHSATGSAHSILANRLSYALDLRGPSMTVDTACSSSLVAVHLACQSLRSGECDLALAGGVNLMLLPSASFAFSQLQILSPHGRCRSFDAAADGIVRGEGCAVVLLKRLSEALRDGDPVLAVIAGSAVNQDGASNGLTAPNGPAQEAVIRRALAVAAIGAERIGLVETHGTGTPLGDPVEVEALARVIGAPRGAGHRCFLAAIKTNLGHLEAAAGITGLVKAVECLRRGQVPANLHFVRPNPHLRLEGTPFVVPTALSPWPRGSLPRVAAVSSFGFGGTNAHVVLEEHVNAEVGDVVPARAELFTVSARSPAALMQALHQMQAALAALPAAALADAVHTATVRRSHHPWRVAVAGSTPAELAQRLEARLSLPPERPAAETNGQVVWVFSGQGGVWPGMARDLYETEPVFAAALTQVCELFERRAGWALLPMLIDPAAGERLTATDVAQPALFALQVALGALWRSLGVHPGAVIGHSVGEIAAAHAAGVLTLADAVEVVRERSRPMHAAFGQGRMAQVECDESVLHDALASFGDRLSIAAFNGPSSTVIGGDPAALAACLQALASRGIVTRELAVDYAFHSAQMDAFVPGIVGKLGHLQPGPATLPLVSTVSGKWAAPGDYRADYWGRNVRQPVRFTQGIAQLIGAGLRSFVEIGPHPALGAGIAAQAEAEGAVVTVVASLRRQQATRSTLLAALGQLHEAGASIDWNARRDPKRRVLALPAYPWQRERHWLDEPDASALAFAVTGRTAALRAAPGGLACYTLTWPPAPLPPATAVRNLAGTAWQVIADATGVGAALAQAIRDAGGRCELTDPAAGALDVRLDGIVDCAALDAKGIEAAAGAMAVARQLARSDHETRLWLVTRGAQPVDAADAPPAGPQALLWGLGRSIALEYPALWGGLVDLDPAMPAAACAAALLDSLRAGDGEDQSAWRAGQRRVARLASRVEPPAATLRLDPAGAYLITGGYGGLGSKIAHWLVSCGARCVVLAGRSGPPSGDAAFDALVEALHRQGVDLLLERADVCDAAAMRSLLGRIGRPLRGVVHAAAALRFHPLDGLGAAEFEELLAAKVQGSLVLHALTRELELDLFVLFSSGTTLFGAKHLAAYAAANQFLGAMARQRVAQGLPATCVEWGAWSEIRLLGREHHDDIHRLGFRTMPDAAAFDMLARLVCAREPQCMVADMDWEAAGQAYQVHGRRPFLANLVPAEPAEGDGAVAAPQPDGGLRGELAALPLRARRERLLALVRTELAGVLGLPGPQAVDAGKGFFDIGLDSLLAVQLRRRLGRLSGGALASTATFNHPTALELAEHLLALMQLADGEAATPAAAGTVVSSRAAVDALADDATPIDALSDDEVRRALQAELEGLVDDAVPAAPGDRR